jgi:hypothetical protein
LTPIAGEDDQRVESLESYKKLFTSGALDTSVLS